MHHRSIAAPRNRTSEEFLFVRASSDEQVQEEKHRWSIEALYVRVRVDTYRRWWWKTKREFCSDRSFRADCPPFHGSLSTKAALLY